MPAKLAVTFPTALPHMVEYREIVENWHIWWPQWQVVDCSTPKLEPALSRAPHIWSVPSQYALKHYHSPKCDVKERYT